MTGLGQTQGTPSRNRHTQGATSVNGHKVTNTAHSQWKQQKNRHTTKKTQPNIQWIHSTGHTYQLYTDKQIGADASLPLILTVRNNPLSNSLIQTQQQATLSRDTGHKVSIKGGFTEKWKLPECRGLSIDTASNFCCPKIFPNLPAKFPAFILTHQTCCNSPSAVL